jgi:hypothetical protein
MEQAGAFSTLHWFRIVSTTIYLPYSIPIGLRTVRHEALELRFRDPMTSHYMIEIFPEYDLCFTILGLHFTARNRQDSFVFMIVYMTRHCSPIGNSFDMVKHDPRVFKRASRLHLADKVHSTTRTNLGHLEDVYFLFLIALAREHVALHVGPIAEASEFCDAVHDSKPAT